jgi:photosystem II stability/assembly factor-like uncharacterized protein
MNTRAPNRRSVAALLLLSPLVNRAADFSEPLNQAARTSALASQSLLLSVTRAGQRLVAVGQRGHIVFSDDQGHSWKQATVPLSTDLTAVYFVNTTLGWAVGHDGVVLHSRDAGNTWVKQLDGRQVNALLVADLEHKLTQQPDARLQRLLTEVQRYSAEGPNKPFLDVWFTDENHGYVVGAFNLIFHTNDGGRHWKSWFDRTENANFSHLNTIRGVGGKVYVAGERGLFLRLEPERQHFVAQATGYSGSFFAMAVAPASLLLFGMRGNAYSSNDQGLSWKKIDMHEQSGLSGATVLDDGRIVAVSQAGQVHVSRDQGATFSTVPGIQPMGFSAVSPAGAQQIALAGTQGVRVQALP